MEIVIEKNVPVAPKLGSNKTGLSDAVLKMEVGDSFVFPKTSITNVYNAIKNVKNYHGHRDRQFTTRSVDDSNSRCWRIN